MDRCGDCNYNSHTVGNSGVLLVALRTAGSNTLITTIRVRCIARVSIISCDRLISPFSSVILDSLTIAILDG
jgi:hypothetical protein